MEAGGVGWRIIAFLPRARHRELVSACGSMEVAMLHAGRIRFTLAAGVAAIALSGATGDLRAQAPNSQPNPYLTIENFFKLPEGRKVGSTAAIDIDRDGSSRIRFE